MSSILTAFRDAWADTWQCLCATPKILRSFHKRHAYLFILLVITCALMIFFYDVPLLRDVVINPENSPSLNYWARKLSFWGDYVPGTIPIAVVLWLIGYCCNKFNLRQAAIACLLAASVSGILANTARLTLGRPRPAAHAVDGFYLFRGGTDYQSFPSGHAATSIGTATALLITAPPVISIPITIGAAGVVWSRMYLLRHNPSDVYVGTWLGIAGGIAFGLAALKITAHRETK